MSELPIGRQQVLCKLESLLVHGYGELTIIVHAGKIVEIVQATRYRESARGTRHLTQRSDD